jgi:hypothetical protein
MKLSALLFLSAVVACTGDSRNDTARTAGTGSASPGAPASPADARSPGGGSSGQSSIELTGSVGGEPVSLSATGECRHEADAYIYGVPSSMWMVSSSGTGNVKRLSATIWRPKNGATEQVQLNLDGASGSYEIDTVTGDKRTAGSASVTIDTRSAGGRIGIDGRDAKGVPIRISVDCPSFSTIEAEGG